METIKSEIISYHVVNIGNSHTPLPIIYIKYNPELIPLIGKTVYTEISKDSIYNGTFESSLFASGNFPSLRPNFFMKYKYMVLLLNTEWKGYPNTKGNIQITYDQDEVDTSTGDEDILPEFVYDSYVQSNDESNTNTSNMMVPSNKKTNTLESKKESYSSEKDSDNNEDHNKSNNNILRLSILVIMYVLVFWSINHNLKQQNKQ